MQSSSGRETASTPEPADIDSYIGDMLVELAALAASTGRDGLSKRLGDAAAEARRGVNDAT